MEGRKCRGNAGEMPVYNAAEAGDEERMTNGTSAATLQPTLPTHLSK
jgi:hypothetical protein